MDYNVQLRRNRTTTAEIDNIVAKVILLSDGDGRGFSDDDIVSIAKRESEDPGILEEVLVKLSKLGLCSIKERNILCSIC